VQTQETTAQPSQPGQAQQTAAQQEQAPPPEAEPKPKLIIPAFLKPETFFKEERKERKERRIRVRRRKDVDEGKAKINPELAKELDIKDKVEVVVVGGGSRERRYVFTVVLDENVPKNEIWCNEDELKRLGVADNTMATVRAYRGSHSS